MVWTVPAFPRATAKVSRPRTSLIGSGNQRSVWLVYTAASLLYSPRKQQGEVEDKTLSYKTAGLCLLLQRNGVSWDGKEAICKEREKIECIINGNGFIWGVFCIILQVSFMYLLLSTFEGYLGFFWNSSQVCVFIQQSKQTWVNLLTDYICTRCESALWYFWNMCIFSFHDRSISYIAYIKLNIFPVSSQSVQLLQNSQAEIQQWLRALYMLDIPAAESHSYCTVIGWGIHIVISLWSWGASLDRTSCF